LLRYATCERLHLGGGEDHYLQGVDFLDVQHGWVAIREDFTQMTDPSYGRIDVWRTTDGGQHWTKTQLPKAVINQFGEILPPVQFDFLDAGDGFAFLSGNIAKGGNDSDLYCLRPVESSRSPSRGSARARRASSTSASR
jgi:hypothetical protein